MKDLYKFIETASVSELFQKRDAVQELIDCGKLGETLGDAKRIMRMINEELLIRATIEDIRSHRA